MNSWILVLLILVLLIVGITTLTIYLRIFATDEIRERVANIIRSTFGLGYGIGHSLFNKENGHLVQFFRRLFSRNTWGWISLVIPKTFSSKVNLFLAVLLIGLVARFTYLLLYVPNYGTANQSAISAEQRTIAPVVSGKLYNPADFGSGTWAIPEFYVLDQDMVNWRGTVTQLPDGALFRYAHWDSAVNAFIDAPNGIKYKNGGEYYKSDGTPVKFQTDEIGWKFVP